VEDMPGLLHGALPVADYPYLLNQFENFKWYLGITGDIQKARQQFFANLVLANYDCMFDGLDEEVGHIAFRLSDFLPEAERQHLMVYPAENGSVITEDVGKWDSLEDWRNYWQTHHSPIPEFDFRRGLGVLALLELTGGIDEPADS
jgi:hypothetical protein